MQVVKLVDPGRVDRVIAFDSLPDSMMVGVTKHAATGFPRAWFDFLGVKKGDNKSLPFFILDFRTTNRDKEKWQEIQNYARRVVDKDFRLMDNLYDMAKPLANDSYSSLELEPEDVLIIPIPKEGKEVEAEEEEKEPEAKTPAKTEEVRKKRKYTKRQAVSV